MLAIPSGPTTTRSEKPTTPPFRVTVNGNASVAGVRDVGGVGDPVGVGEPGTGAVGDSPAPDVESSPHPARTSPAVATSAAYRIVFTLNAYPFPGNRQTSCMGWYTNVIRSLGHQSWFAVVGRVVVPVDRWLQQKTRGRINMIGRAELPTLLLTTQGRKSGQARIVPLLYVTDNDNFVVTASNWGRRAHPDWSANLLANPNATVSLAGREIQVRATLAEGAERDRVWGLVTKVWPAYDTYVERSGRAIRIFILTPVS
jgi:deazaflavin-dependent oxidoreductase (nitroreductase family)